MRETFLQDCLSSSNKSGILYGDGYSYKCKVQGKDAHYFYCNNNKGKCRASVILRNGTFRRGKYYWNPQGIHTNHQPQNLTRGNGQEYGHKQRRSRQLLARSVKLVRKGRERYGISNINPGYVGSGDGKGHRLLIEQLLTAKTDETGKRFFLVKWMGFPKWDSSWEAGDNLPISLIMKFDLDKEKEDKRRVGSSQPHPLSINGQRKDSYRIVRKLTKSLFPSEYLMIKKIFGEVMVLGKFRDTDNLHLVPFNLARIKTPQMLIRFLQGYLKPVLKI